MPTTLSGQVSALATQIGTDVKSLLASIGDLSALTTTQKASLVVALNELKASLTALEDELGAQIDDDATATTTTWSSTKITAQISAAVTALVNGAPGTLDTLKELADAIETNQDAIAAIQSVAAGHVKFDAAQSLDDTQKAQARSNIGAASTTDVSNVSATIGTLGSLETTDQSSVVAAVNEVKSAADSAASAAATADAKAVAAQSAASTAQSTANAAQSTASAAQTAVNSLSTSVGDTTTDFVKIYTTARDGSE